MIWRTTKLVYGCKNFKGHMGIKDNITLAGLLKRSERRNPRFFSFLRKAAIISGLYFITMSLVPGSDLPLQTSIKQTIYAFSLFTSKLWRYNMFDPNGAQYLININQLILMAMDNQIYNITFLGKHLLEIRGVVEGSKRHLKNDNYLDLLLYAEIILQNMVRYDRKLLLDPLVLDYYEWIYATIFTRLKNQRLKDKENKHVKLLYSVIQYLLNFGGQQKMGKYVHQYYQLVEQANKDQHEIQTSFQYLVMKRGLEQKQFTNSLIKIYNESRDEVTKQEILAIFQKLNEVFNQQPPKIDNQHKPETQQSVIGSVHPQ